MFLKQPMCLTIILKKLCFTSNLFVHSAATGPNELSIVLKNVVLRKQRFLWENIKKSASVLRTQTVKVTNAFLGMN